jgi:SAM-dependent methyltransferase
VGGRHQTGAAPQPCEHAYVIEAQRRLLADRIRNRAYAEAIRLAITAKRTRVADLGTGTGFLSILCERAGARSIWACDGDAGVIKLARATAKDNSATRVRFVHGHSTALAPPEPVDLIVSEILGHFAGEEHLVESLVDAQRWLAPGGRMIPARVEQWLCPVTGDTVQRGIDVFTDHQGVNLTAARRIALQNGYVRTLDPRELLDGGRAGQVIDRMSFPGDEASRRHGAAAWTLPKGPIHGFCLWWVAELWEGVALSTSPLEPATHWEQVYLPLQQPLMAQAGDRLEAELRLDTRWDAGCAVQWSGRLARAGKAVATFSQDNRVGVMKG